MSSNDEDEFLKKVFRNLLEEVVDNSSSSQDDVEEEEDDEDDVEAIERSIANAKNQLNLNKDYYIYDREYLKSALHSNFFKDKRSRIAAIEALRRADIYIKAGLTPLIYISSDALSVYVTSVEAQEVKYFQ